MMPVSMFNAVHLSGDPARSTSRSSDLVKLFSDFNYDIPCVLQCCYLGLHTMSLLDYTKIGSHAKETVISWVLIFIYFFQFLTISCKQALAFFVEKKCFVNLYVLFRSIRKRF